MLGQTALEINKNISTRFKLSTSDSKIWSQLFDFFSVKDNWNILLDFLRNDSKISLRVIDYFLTTYCYNKKIIYKSKNIFTEYKEQLKKYHKKYFDPCSRGTKIPFFFDKDNCVITTICQLNFLKWFIKTKYYVKFLDEYKEIKNDMKNKSKRIKSNSFIVNYKKNNTIYCSTEKNIKAMFD